MTNNHHKTNQVRRRLGVLAACRDADEVAMSLLAGEWHGHIASVETCPVARFLARGKIELAIAGSVAYVFNGLAVARLEVPENVAEFIRLFDKKQYPDLIDPTEREI